MKYKWWYDFWIWFEKNESPAKWPLFTILTQLSFFGIVVVLYKISSEFATYLMGLLTGGLVTWFVMRELHKRNKL